MQKQFTFDTPAVTSEQAAAPAGYAGIYGFHKYWGKKPHELIAYLIQRLTNPGDIVVDPFLGSGSSAREAMIRNRRFIGFDINPVAVQLAEFITAPPSYNEVCTAFKVIEVEAKSAICDSYSLSSGEMATHYLWEAETLRQIWIKGNSKLPRREIAPSNHDLALIESFNSYQSRLKRSPTFFSNGRINATPDMNLDSLLTRRAQRNIDLLVQSISTCAGTVRRALQLCLTAASGQMTRMVFAVTGRGKTRGATAEKVEVGSWVIGYWRPRLHFEVNVWNCFENRVRKLLSAIKGMANGFQFNFAHDLGEVSDKPACCYLGEIDCRKGLQQLANASCSLVIADPPHSDRVPYLELSEFWNTILDRRANLEDEIVISNAKERGKTAERYQVAIAEFLRQAARILRPGGSLVVFFNARQSRAWEAIRDFSRSPTEHGLVYSGRFPCTYSANSVVQDNRKGAMKHDWVLVFAKVPASQSNSDNHCLSEIPGWLIDFPDQLVK